MCGSIVVLSLHLVTRLFAHKASTAGFSSDLVRTLKVAVGSAISSSTFLSNLEQGCGTLAYILVYNLLFINVGISYSETKPV